MKMAGTERLNKSLVALLLLGMGYFALMLFLNTSSPFLLVRGVSMQPTLHAGDLLLNRVVAPTEIKIGDVITFEVSEDAQKRLKMPPKATHRVIGIEGQGGEVVFVTKGDNSDIDPFNVPSSTVRGVVVKNLGPLGWPILILTNKTLLLFLGVPIITFALIVLATLWLSSGEKEQPAVAGRASSRPRRGLSDQLPKQIGLPLDRLTSAVSAYGVHLQSHTSIIKHMAGSSEGLEEAVQQQNQILAELASVVRDLKYYKGSNDLHPKVQTQSNGKGNAAAPINDASIAESIARKAIADGRRANGNGYAKNHTTNGVAESIVKKAKTNGHKTNGHNNGVAESTVKKTTANGHNGNGHTKEWAGIQTRDERVRDLVAAIEKRIKAEMD